ncbi:MAG: hypothetical protein HeimC3_11120 [Candidatus Heimdallarchaeota archaeon LC_3]|nr:MAG: hypothetical protein HeimC3_11120 [Candidatus Heimdallarchaeota archaeon LC_3]
MTEISSELLENLPELKSLLQKEEFSAIEYLNNIFKEFKDNRNDKITSELSLSDFFVNKMAINRNKIVNENLLYIGAFYALWKGKLDEYQLFRNRLSKQKINYFYTLCLENLFHILFTGNISKVNQNLEAIKIYLEKHGIGESKERSQLLINYFGIKSYLFDLKGNDVKCNQFYTFALRETSDQQLDADSLIIPTILRIILLLDTDVEIAQQLTLDLINTLKSTENRFFISIAQLYLGKTTYLEKDSITAHNIYSNLRKRLNKLQAAPLLLLLNIQVGDLEFLVGRTKKALNIYKNVISTATIASMPRMIVLGLRHLGDIYLLQLNLNVSQDLYEKAVIITKKIHDHSNRAYCLQQLGSIYLAQKNYVEAHKTFLESLELIEHFKIRKLNLTFELGQLFLNLKDEINITKMSNVINFILLH